MKRNLWEGDKKWDFVQDSEGRDEEGGLCRNIFIFDIVLLVFFTVFERNPAGVKASAL